MKVRCFPNQKPGINTEVGIKFKDRAATHRAIPDNPGAKAEDRNKYKKTSLESSNKQKHNIGMRWNHTTQAPVNGSRDSSSLVSKSLKMVHSHKHSREEGTTAPLIRMFAPSLYTLMHTDTPTHT